MNDEKLTDNIQLSNAPKDTSEASTIGTDETNLQSESSINLKRKKLKLNPWKLGFVLILVIAVFTLLLLENFVPSFEAAFESFNEMATEFLLGNPWISLGIYLLVMILKSLGMKDLLELKRISLVSVIASLYNRNPEYSALIAFWVLMISGTLEAISAVLEFKFIGIESQTVNNTLLEWFVLVLWYIVYYILIFPVQYIANLACDTQLCPYVYIKQGKKKQTSSEKELEEKEFGEDCFYKFVQYMSYDNEVFKLVGKNNVEQSLTLLQFLKKSPYCIMNNKYSIYPFAIIMLIFNGLSAFNDAVFMLFTWEFSKESIIIVWGYNCFDVESYLKTWITTDQLLNTSTHGNGIAGALFLVSIVNATGKVVGLIVTYLINIFVCKPIAALYPKLYNRKRKLTFDIAGIDLNYEEKNETINQENGKKPKNDDDSEYSDQVP